MFSEVEILIEYVWGDMDNGIELAEYKTQSLNQNDNTEYSLCEKRSKWANEIVDIFIE